MKVLFVDKSYSIQTCPVCKRRKKGFTRNYRCHCGYISHRDITFTVINKSIYRC
ncbi:zinc ribbon domain-containing protein [Aneurinibacillus thermoaerophilus]|uniref:zinc ribbon domain-containing protein n=1 Tax=Aneurinibacillus thermoaerophilus TaxID=143495 RepID=UPI00399CFB92